MTGPPLPSQSTFDALKRQDWKELTNQILASLPRESQEYLAIHVFPVYLESGSKIYDYDQLIEYLYFATTATASLQALLGEGLAIEVAVVGREGVVGLEALLGNRRAVTRVVAQLPGEFLRIPLEIMRHEFNRNGVFQRLILLFTGTLFSVVSRNSVCSARHSVKQRFSRWLLTVHDRGGSDNIPLTQEFIAQLLGSRRATITLVAHELQNAKAISCSRGMTRVLDRKLLAELACECYHLNKQDLDRYTSSTVIPI